VAKQNTTKDTTSLTFLCYHTL